MVTAKTTVILVLAYVLALAAGTTSGLLAQRLRGPGPADADAPMAAQLHLTPAQARQMRQVWEKASNDMDDYYRQAQAISRQRDQALFNLLTDDQKEKFATMDQAYNDRFAALAKQRQATFRSAIAKAEESLSDDQRQKYERIVRQRMGWDPLHPEAGTQPSADQLRP